MAALADPTGSVHVRHGEAMVRVADATDMIAWHIFGRADQAGEPVTMAMVESRLTELLGHGPGCHCRLHQAAAVVRVQQVNRSAAALQRAVGKTRILAAR